MIYKKQEYNHSLNLNNVQVKYKYAKTIRRYSNEIQWSISHLCCRYSINATLNIASGISKREVVRFQIRSLLWNVCVCGCSFRAKNRFTIESEQVHMFKVLLRNEKLGTGMIRGPKIWLKSGNHKNVTLFQLVILPLAIQACFCTSATWQLKKKKTFN